MNAFIPLPELIQLKFYATQPDFPISLGKVLIEKYIQIHGRGNLVHDFDINPIWKFEQAVTTACIFFDKLDINKYIQHEQSKW